LLADVEERLRFNANLPAPRVLEVSMPPSQALVSVVDGAADRREGRVPLDAWIAEREVPLEVARVERLDYATT
jgi:hypothetical protein